MNVPSFPKTLSLPQSMRSLFLGLVWAMVVLVVVVTATVILYAHRQVERSVQATTAKLANTLVLTFESRIDTIDVILQNSADEIARRLDQANGRADAADISQYLERQMRHLPSAFLRASDAHGDVIYVPGPGAVPAHIRDREYFTYLRDHPQAGLFINRPVVGKINGKWVWLFARRITTANQRFGGVVFGRIELDELEKLLAQIPLDSGGSIALRDAQLTLVAGRMQSGAPYPFPIGGAEVSADFRNAVRTNPGEGSYRTRMLGQSQVTGTFSFKASPKYGFLVNAGSTGELAWSQWRRQAWATGLPALLFVALMLGFTRLIGAAWRRQDEGVIALQKAQEIAKLGSFRYDLRTRSLNSSEQLRRIFGMPPPPPSSLRPWLDAVVEPSGAVVVEQAKEVLAEQASFYKEFRIVRPNDGQTRWMHCRGILECSDKGTPVAVTGTVQDITERKAAEDAIRQFNETLEMRIAQRTQELEQAMLKLRSFQEELMKSEARATISTLVASVSHELNTPIGNSVMVATTLKDEARRFKGLSDSGTLKRSDFADFLVSLEDGTAMIEHNLQRTEVLLRNFRQVSADQASEQRRTFDLRQMLLEVLKTVEPSLKRQPHQVVIRVPEGITMDSLPGPLGQVTINLINNAYLHAFEARDDGLLEMDAVVDAGQVQLRFSDNGRGMSPEQQRHLFEPFFSTKIGRGGTGLGMAIVQNLVTKSLGGRISVQSAVGEGTRYLIELPLVLPRTGTSA